MPFWSRSKLQPRISAPYGRSLSRASFLTAIGRNVIRTDGKSKISLRGLDNIARVRILLFIDLGGCSDTTQGQLCSLWECNDTHVVVVVALVDVEIEVWVVVECSVTELVVVVVVVLVMTLVVGDRVTLERVSYCPLS